MQQVNTRLTGRRQYRFGPYRLDVAERRLWRDGKPVALTSKVFDVLAVLVANSGRPMDKDEIMRQVWPDSIVEEGNLARNVSTLRKILGDSPEDGRYVSTLPGRGYQFVHSVQEILEGSFGTSEPEAAIGLEDTADNLLAEEPSCTKRAPRAWYLTALCLLLTVIGAVVWFSRDLGPIKTDPLFPDGTTLAVLPFLWLSPAPPEDEHLGVGMADTLITRLGGLRQMVVRPTSSVLKYQSPERNLQKMGRELKVQLVIDGSLHRVGERIRVTARLIKVEDGQTLWADKFDESWSDLLKVEDAIAERTVAGLALGLTGEERQAFAGRGASNAQAFNLYSKARYLFNKRTGPALRQAISYFEQALIEDPNYAMAHVGLADAYMALAVFGLTLPADSYPRAKAAAQRALELNDRLGEPHVTLGLASLYERDRPGAEREYRRAIELNPNYAFAHHLYAIFLGSGRRETEAMDEIQRALELDPVSPTLHSMKGALLFGFGHNRQAIKQLGETIELEPHFWHPHFWLAMVYVDEKRNEEALTEAVKAAELSGGSNSWILGYVQGVSGRRLEAEKTLERMLARRESYVSPFDVGMVYLGLGRKEEALDWLDRAYQHRSRWMDSLPVLPAFDPLRAEPRFQALQRRLDLPQQ